MSFTVQDRKRDDSRKGAKTPSSENSENILTFAPLRLGGIIFLELVLFNISEVRIEPS